MGSAAAEESTPVVDCLGEITLRVLQIVKSSLPSLCSQRYSLKIGALVYYTSTGSYSTILIANGMSKLDKNRPLESSRLC